jgi:hypothetical protein
VKGGHAGGDRNKKWQGVNGQCKQQGKQNAEAEKAEDDAKDQHSGNLRDEESRITPPPPPWRREANVAGSEE